MELHLCKQMVLAHTWTQSSSCPPTPPTTQPLASRLSLLSGLWPTSDPENLFSVNSNYTTDRHSTSAVLSKRVQQDERQPTLNLHDWHVFRFLMVISHLLSNLHWKFRLFLFCQLTALLKYTTGQKGALVMCYLKKALQEKQQWPP